MMKTSSYEAEHARGAALRRLQYLKEETSQIVSARNHMADSRCESAYVDGLFIRKEGTKAIVTSNGIPTFERGWLMKVLQEEVKGWRVVPYQPLVPMQEEDDGYW